MSALKICLGALHRHNNVAALSCSLDILASYLKQQEQHVSSRPLPVLRNFSTLTRPDSNISHTNQNLRSQHTAVSIPLAESLATAHALIDQAQVAKLKQDLDEEAEHKLHIPYAELLLKCKKAGAARDDKEAEELSASLHKAGVVMRIEDTVYLRPVEIADLVTQLLPAGKEDAQKKIAEIETELAELDGQYQRIHRTAHTWTSMFLVGGCMVLATQLVAFIYLTWFEYSWDVMEPYGYIIQLFYALVAYIYFLVTRGQTFDLGPFRKYWTEQLLRRHVQQVKFDEDRHRYLIRLRERYERYLTTAVKKN